MTSFFVKALVKQRTKIAEIEKRKLGPNEQKGKEKVTVLTLKKDTSKLLPRKSTRATLSDAIIESIIKPIGSGGELGQAKATNKVVERDAKEESPKKHKAQNKLSKRRKFRAKALPSQRNKRPQVKDGRK